jgi:hypothetical protein
MYLLALQVSPAHGVPFKADTQTPYSQLAISRLPGSLATALIGLFAGQIYRSDLANLKTFRISSTFARFSSRFILPLIGSLRPPRRSNRALPDETIPSLGTNTNTNSNQAPSLNGNDEIITTGRSAGSGALPPGTRADPGGGHGGEPLQNGSTGTSVVREWVNELTGRSDRAGVRVPPEAEISQLMVMFPDVQREVVLGALQRRYVASHLGSFTGFASSDCFCFIFIYFKQPKYRRRCGDSSEFSIV